MPLNPDLSTRVWMHNLTHVLYRVYADGVRIEPVVQYSMDDGKSWNASQEYSKVKYLCDDIAGRNLVLRFTPKKTDLAGVEGIRAICEKTLAEITHSKSDPHASKANVGRKAGRMETLKTVINFCDEYLSRVRDEKPLEPIDALLPDPDASVKVDSPVDAPGVGHSH